MGKSFKIRKLIEKEDKKTYYHFPLGGKLTKNDIYQKIIILFEKIKKDEKLKKEKIEKNEIKSNKEQINEEYYV